MAYLNYRDLTSTSVDLYVDGLFDQSIYDTIYITCNGRTSSNLAKTFYSTYSLYFRLSGLSPGTYYSASWSIKTKSGSTASGVGGITTPSSGGGGGGGGGGSEIGGVGFVYCSQGSSLGSVNVSWSYATNATSYRIEVYDSYGNFLNYVLTSFNSCTFSGLSGGQTYTIKVYGQRAGYSNGAPSYGSITISGGIEVGSVGWVLLTQGTSAGSINASWSYATNATSYRAEAYNINGVFLKAVLTTLNYCTIDGLQAGQFYDVKVYGQRSGSPNGPPSWAGITLTSTQVGGVGNVYCYQGGSSGAIQVVWSAATNATSYRIEAYNMWGDFITYTTTTSTSVYLYGLEEGTYYSIKVYGQRSGSSNGEPSYGSITTTTYAVGGISTISVTPDTQSGVLNVSWSAAANATSYRVELYDYNYNFLNIAYHPTTTSQRITGLAEHTTYVVKVYGQRSGKPNGSHIWGVGSTRSYEPGATTNLSASPTSTAGGIYASWSAATNASMYRWEVYLGNTTNTSYFITGGNVTSTSVNITGLSESTLYTVKVYAQRSGYTNGQAATTTVTTSDLTPPIISSITGDGRGRMYVLFYAYDNQSGLRSSNTYYTTISNANGTTYGQGAYSTNNYRTFTADANGYTFTHDAYYYMRVVVYDNAGNNTSSNVRVQYKIARPGNWEWHQQKVAGAKLNLTAAEWNSFCIKINQFRQYKSLGNYSFTTVSSGTRITASLMNQARTALSAITTAPPSVNTGDIIRASYFNTLRDNMNNIQ